MALNILSRKSTNFTSGRIGFKPEAIVIHIMEGTLAGTDSWFGSTISKVSAHYGIGRNGDIHQYVKEEDTAWHAGRVDHPSWDLIKKGAIKQFINPNYYTIGIEHEGNENSDWPESLYQTSASLINDICERNNIPIDRQHIIGHHEIYSLKTCPGHVVDLDKLIVLASGKNVVGEIPIDFKGSVITTTRLRIRTGKPSITAPVKRIVDAGSMLKYFEIVKGDTVEDSFDWYSDGNNSFWWGGGCQQV